MRLVIADQENNMMQVGIDGVFYDDLNGTQLAGNIHAVQWYDTHGEIEYKDLVTGNMTHNTEIDSIADFQFAVDAWYVAKAAEEVAIALQEAKDAAYQSAYDQAIANGDSEEDAIAAGGTAADAVTSA